MKRTITYTENTLLRHQAAEHPTTIQKIMLKNQVKFLHRYMICNLCAYIYIYKHPLKTKQQPKNHVNTFLLKKKSVKKNLPFKTDGPHHRGSAHVPSGPRGEGLCCPHCSSSGWPVAMTSDFSLHFEWGNPKYC